MSRYDIEKFLEKIKRTPFEVLLRVCKPDSVLPVTLTSVSGVYNHVSGIIVTDDLKRLFQQQFQLKIAAGHGLARR